MFINAAHLIKRRALIKMALGVVAAPWLLTGCRQKPPLLVAGHVWPGYEFIHLADHFNWLDKQEIILTKTKSASHSMDALRQGRVQAAMLTLDETIRLCSEGLELEIVLIFNISLGADVIISRPDITELYQLEGKRVGFEKTALGALMFHQLLKQARLTTDQVTPINFTIDDHHQAWLRPDIDALITYEPIASQIINTGNAYKLFDSRKMPDMIFDVLVVRKNLTTSQKRATEKLIAQHFQALRYFQSNPTDASHRMAERLDLIPEQVLTLFNGLFIPNPLANHAYLSKHDNRLANSAQTLLQVMKTADILAADCDLNRLYNNQFLPRDIL